MNKNLDKSNLFGAAFMDLSKVFYAINHDPLIAKFEVSGFPYIYIRSYLNQRLQRTNVNNSFSLWKDIITDVPLKSSLFKK